MRQTISRWAALAAVTTLAWTTAPAFAGIHYQAVTTQDSTRGRAPGDMKVEGWVSGEKGRIEFKESGNPMAKSGTYILTQDGGKTLYLVSPEDKTYARWDLNAMLGALGGIMNGMGPLLKFEFTDPKVEKVAEGDGGTVAGIATRHFKYRISYSMKMRVLGFGNSADTVIDQDIWAATKFQDPALGVWLRQDPPRTGNEQFDKLITAQVEKERVTGFPLKTVATTTTTQKGKQTVSHRTLEVTLIESRSVADSQFAIPSGYKETQMLPTPEKEQRDR
ncbi:MAG TPA: DUF4412 domain-containing protein [Thermoanaerobaculia bacterium]|nr:DUF4412 domain-containing protein [Thermoanaerobaculia bacterium]